MRDSANRPVDNHDAAREHPVSLAPFLKWPGGKRWAGPEIGRLVRAYLHGTYYEPFLGSGALFFHVQPANAVLSDLNVDLINTYAAVQRDWRRIVRHLKLMEVSKAFFEEIRRSQPRGDFTAAARFLYLNRTAFAGIYRVNRRGEFNVPFGGRKPDLLWDRNLLKKCAHALAQVQLRTGDFEHYVDSARKGDVVYCDPTYTAMHDDNGFIRYNESNFSWADQERLARAALRAKKRHATVIISNAHRSEVERLYGNADRIVLSRTSRVSRDISGRKLVKEYVFIVR